MDLPDGRDRMIAARMAKKLLGGATGALSAAAAAARHVAWYVSYRIDGKARKNRRD
jgi:hypothetical protein